MLSSITLHIHKHKCVHSIQRWLVTHVHDLGFTSPLSSLPLPSPSYELPFGISTRLSLSPQRDPVAVLSASLSSLTEQTVSWGGGGVEGVAVGWDRHWIITSSHSSQRKNDGEKKKGQNKNVTRHTEVLTLFPSCPHSHPKLMYTFPLTHGTLAIWIRALNGYPDCCIYLFGTPGEFLISLIV